MKKLITSDLLKGAALLFVGMVMWGGLSAQPICNATFAQQPGTTVNSVHFTSFGNPLNSTIYAWDFGDGHSSTQANPTHTYAPGSYLACLSVTVVSTNGTVVCTANYCDSVHVGTTTVNCNAQFVQQPLAPNSIFFSGTGTNTGATYQWDFGDGATSTNPQAIHTYAPGNYLACLTVTVATSAGTILCTDTYCDSVHIGPSTVNCNAQFTHQGGSATNGVYFTSSTNSAGTSYHWTFGDGHTSTLPNPVHAYAPGSYLACLTVTVPSPNGTVLCTATYCDSVYVGPTSVSCNAHFTHQLSTTGEHFTSAANAANTVYAWDFGDGHSSSQANPTHLYAPGSYLACLTVTVYSSASGVILCTATHCDSVHIGMNVPGCHADFSYQHTSATLTYAFTNLSSPNATGYSWHFGDASTSTQVNPVHHYAAPGSYQVCVTMLDSVNHCSRTRCKILTAPFLIAPAAAIANSFAKQAGNHEPLSVSIYPNPTAEIATIHIENAGSLSNFKLYDNAGRLVYQKDHLKSGVFEFITADYPAGLYYYNVSNDDSTAGGKLVIEK